MLANALPDLNISSAGIGALVDHPADETMTNVAEENGLSLEGHRARQFTPQMGAAADLILVMEPKHKLSLQRQSPQLVGRTMLFDQWTGAKGIADPYRMPEAIHKEIFAEIKTAAEAWAAHLTPKE